jgi:hypothetical protein
MLSPLYSTPKYSQKALVTLISITNRRHFHPSKPFTMPLVVPGINSQGGDKSKTEEWTNKLVGKKLGEGSDATVCISLYPQIRNVGC